MTEMVQDSRKIYLRSAVLSDWHLVDSGDVPVGTALHRGLGVFWQHAVPPTRIDAVIGKRPDGFDDPLDQERRRPRPLLLLRNLRDRIGVTGHLRLLPHAGGTGREAVRPDSRAPTRATRALRPGVLPGAAPAGRAAG